MTKPASSSRFSFLASHRIPIILVVIFVVIFTAGFLGWDSVRKVGAQVINYFSDDPDRPPNIEGDWDEADYKGRRDEFIALLRGNDPNKPLDPTSRIRAIEQMDRQEAQMRKAAARQGSFQPLANWTELGPNPIPNGQTQTVTSAVSGRTISIEVDPADPNKVYAGTAQGGIFRSLDGGTNWTPIFDGAQSLAVGALTLDAANNRLWVGTGEPPAGPILPATRPRRLLHHLIRRL